MVVEACGVVVDVREALAARLLRRSGGSTGWRGEKDKKRPPVIGLVREGASDRGQAHERAQPLASIPSLVARAAAAALRRPHAAAAINHILLCAVSVDSHRTTQQQSVQLSLVKLRVRPPHEAAHACPDGAPTVRNRSCRLVS